jgi:uncharacterized protein
MRAAPPSRPRPDAAARLVCAALTLFVALVLIAPAKAADPDYPALTGRVVDDAGLLSAEDERTITVDLEALEKKTTDQLVLVTLPSLQGFEIEEFGYKLGRHWGVGQEGKDNGVILIVAPKERKVRIEVGRGLEGVLPDAIAKVIIENAILPKFRSGDFPGGIKAGLRDITLVLTGDAEAVTLRSKDTGEEVGDWVAILILVVWVLIFGFVMWSIITSIRHGVKTGKGGKSSGWTWGSGSSSGGWSSGGGGFSGGGGGFGGGGASGGW